MSVLRYFLFWSIFSPVLSKPEYLRYARYITHNNYSVLRHCHHLYYVPSVRPRFSVFTQIPKPMPQGPSGRAPGATRTNLPFYSITPDSNADFSRQLDKQRAFTKEMQLDITAAHSRAHKSWCIVTVPERSLKRTVGRATLPHDR